MALQVNHSNFEEVVLQYSTQPPDGSAGTGPDDAPELIFPGRLEDIVGGDDVRLNGKGDIILTLRNHQGGQMDDSVRAVLPDYLREQPEI